MDAKKAVQIQTQLKNNVNSLQTYFTELQSWESEMKRKEAALTGEFEQDLPPVRSKIKKEKPVAPVKKEPAKRIKSSDYRAWEQFDVDKACEDVDMEDVGPTSLDSNKSAKAKQDKLRDEAQYEKERGNNFVKQEKWDEAIACYTRAIELVKDDAIYFANRGLCYLKKDSLHQAEKDCTEALRLDPTYVKALQRRGTAREQLGSLRAAADDLRKVLALEPHNAAAKRQIETITRRMGTKGSKSKSSPQTSEARPISESKPKPKIIDITDAQVTNNIQQVANEKTELEKWQDGDGEPVTVIKPVKKPPHLRSKRALKPVTIQEIALGHTTVSSQKPPTRLKIEEINGNGHVNGEAKRRDEKGQGDMKTNVINKGSPESEKLNIDHSFKEKNIKKKPIEEINKPTGEINKPIGEINKPIGEINKPIGEINKPIGEINKPIGEIMKPIEGKNKIDLEKLVAPVNSVQFMQEWKYLKGSDEARSHYLSLIDPTKIPAIFANALESDILSEVLHTLRVNRDNFKGSSISAYLRGLTGVKRFSALIMFLSPSDQILVKELLEYCKATEKCPENEIDDLKNKFEL